MKGKKVRITIAVLAVLVITGGAIFAALTGNLTLQGTVAANVAITVTPEAGASTLALVDGTGAVADLKVATVNEKSNKDGYTVELTSSNSGKLIGAANSDELAYTATYNGVAVTLSSTAVEITDNTSTQTTGTGVDKDFDISYTIVDGALSADTYSDSLTFTIIAN